MIPAPSELRHCRDCGEPILWTTTQALKRLAVDPHPDERGNQACYRVSYRGWLSRSLDATGAPPPTGWEHRYKPHVASCAKLRPVQPELPGLLPPNVIPLDLKRRRRTR